MVAPIASITQPESLINQASGTGTIQRITQAIKTASARTGVDFSYLLNKASQESGFDPNAKASNSSATGLFQFTQQTWLQMVKNYGGKYGLDQYSSAITSDKNGVLHVSDPHARQIILSMRKDPTISAEMAGELDKENMGALTSDVGGKIGPTELYLAHFLGAGGATDFLNTLKNNPKANAASVLPDAAAANPSVFYNQAGEPRSVAQIYRQFADKFNHAPDIPNNAKMTMVASAEKLPSTNIATATNAFSQPSTYVPSVINSTKPNAPSSLYTAMVIAQMNVKDSAGSHLSGTANSDHRKGLASSLLFSNLA